MLSFYYSWTMFQLLPRLCLHDSDASLSAQFIGRYLMLNSNTQIAIMRTHLCRFKFVMLIHVMMSLPVIDNIEHLVSISYAIQESSLTGNNFIMNYLQRKHPMVKKFRENKKFSALLLKHLIVMVSVTWFLRLISLSGDLQPNPGPSSASSTSSSMDSSVTTVLRQFHHLSFIFYNVQSIFNKLDVLTAELSDFDMLAFSESCYIQTSQMKN